MSRRISSGLAAALCLACTHTKPLTPSAPPPPSLVPFEVRSLDGKVILRGEIDFPVGASSDRLPLALMVPGTGPFDRDVHFSTDDAHSPSEAKRGLIFKELSTALNNAGVATLRFDKRGFRCSELTMPQPPALASHRDVRRFFQQHCVDEKEAVTLSPTSFREDITQLYRLAVRDPRIDPDRIVVFAHSEGSLHVARLVESRAIQPRGVVFMGGFAESPKEVIHWQSVDRVLGSLLDTFDANHDGVLSQNEVKEALRRPGMGPQAQKMFMGAGPWTRADLVATLETQYQEARAKALAQPDDALFGHLASYAWWKMWFDDDRPVMDSLYRYPGKIVFHNGDGDIQTPVAREFALLESHRGRFAAPPKLVRHVGLGHSLGNNPIVGPMIDSAQRDLVADIVGVTSPE